MTTDLVPADNMSALESLTPADREVAVTHMLSEARGWLAHAKEVTGPAEIATFKAYVATIAESTKQLNLSKEIQLDAQEMVRRAERGVGVAIREGQERGEITKRTDNGFSSVRQGDNTSYKSRPADFVPQHQLASSEINPGIYDMADGISDEQFEEAVTEAKAEGNLARANVVRKIRTQPTSPSAQTRQQRADLIVDLAARGFSSSQMTSKVGVSEDSVRLIARDFEIEIPADKATRKTARINSTDVVRNIVAGYANALVAESAINWSDVDPTEADEWVDSLIASIGAARAFIRKINKIKEPTHV